MTWEAAVCRTPIHLGEVIVPYKTRYKEAGQPLVNHVDVNVVAFTGSYEVGSMIKPESTEGGRRVSVLKRQEGAPVLLG